MENPKIVMAWNKSTVPDAFNTEVSDAVKGTDALGGALHAEALADKVLAIARKYNCKVIGKLTFKRHTATFKSLDDTDTVKVNDRYH